MCRLFFVLGKMFVFLSEVCIELDYVIGFFLRSLMNSLSFCLNSVL